MKTVVGLVALLSAVSACGGGDSSTSALTTPSTLVTESFTGTVAVGATDFHTFSVSSSGGAINVTLTAAGPPPTIYMGIGVGTPSASTCALLNSGSAVAPAGISPQLSGTLSSGTYCVSVFDVGNQ